MGRSSSKGLTRRLPCSTAWGERKGGPNGPHLGRPSGPTAAARPLQHGAIGWVAVAAAAAAALLLHAAKQRREAALAVATRACTLVATFVCALAAVTGPLALPTRDSAVVFLVIIAALVAALFARTFRLEAKLDKQQILWSPAAAAAKQLTLPGFIGDEAVAATDAAEAEAKAEAALDAAIVVAANPLAAAAAATAAATGRVDAAPAAVALPAGDASLDYYEVSEVTTGDVWYVHAVTTEAIWELPPGARVVAKHVDTATVGAAAAAAAPDAAAVDPVAAQVTAPAAEPAADAAPAAAPAADTAALDFFEVSEAATGDVWFVNVATSAAIWELPPGARVIAKQIV